MSYWYIRKKNVNVHKYNASVIQLLYGNSFFFSLYSQVAKFVCGDNDAREAPGVLNDGNAVHLEKWRKPSE